MQNEACVGAMPTPEYLTVIQKLKLYQEACRLLAAALPPFEFSLYTAILDRTVGWGKNTCFVTAKQLKDGDNRHGGLQMHLTQVARGIKALKDKGLILSKGVRNRGTKITIPLVMEGNQVALAKPKRLNINSSQHIIGTGITCSQTIELETTKEETTDKIVPAAPSSPEEVVRKIKDRPRSKPHRTHQSVWNDAVKENHPSMHLLGKWSAAEAGAMAKTAKRWREDKPFDEFLEWSVENWKPIMLSMFGWMNDPGPPTAPAPLFFVKFVDKFIDCYAERKLHEWMSAPDRTKYERLVAAGSTPEKALYEIAETSAIGKTRGEVNSKLAAATRAANEAARRLKMAEQATPPPTQPTKLEPRQPPKKLVERKYGDNLAYNLPEWED